MVNLFRPTHIDGGLSENKANNVPIPWPVDRLQRPSGAASTKYELSQ